MPADKSPYLVVKDVLYAMSTMSLLTETEKRDLGRKFKKLKLLERYALVGMLQRIPIEETAEDMRVGVTKLQEARASLIENHAGLIEILAARVANNKPFKPLRRRKVSRALRSQRSNRLVGLCYCGTFHEEDTVMCPRCLGNARKYNARRHEELKRLGICVVCRDPKKELADALYQDRKLIRCKDCQELTREKNHERWLKLRDAGICVQCGKRPPLTGFLRCKKCNDTHTASAEATNKKRRGGRPARKYVLTKKRKPRAFKYGKRPAVVDKRLECQEDDDEGVLRLGGDTNEGDG